MKAIRIWGIVSLMAAFAMGCSDDDGDSSAETGEPSTELDDSDSADAEGADEDAGDESDGSVADADGETEPGGLGEPFSYVIDDSLEFAYDDVVRPDGENALVAVLAGPDGRTTGFVEGEVLIAGDSAEFSPILNEFGAEIVASLDASEAGLDGLPMYHLVRVSLDDVTLDSFVDDMRAVSDEGMTMGELAFSSESGAKTMALAALAAEAGLDASVSWVGVRDSLETLTSLEAPVSNQGWATDAFTWPHFATTATQAVGVDMAWALLDRSGRVNNSVGLAILDGGICTTDNQDFPADVVTINASGTGWITGDNLCNATSFAGDSWHGTHVFGAAMGIFDNNYGTTGPGAPVADPAIAVNVLYDPFSTAAGLMAARQSGAQIGSMSYRWTLPYGTGWTVRGYYTDVTNAMRAAGMLLFGSAGNEDENVDNVACIGVTVDGNCIGDQAENWLHVPCELPAVTCVGGAALNQLSMAPNSNFGTQDVEIVGPYTVPEGPEPPDMTNDTDSINGTSFATPFVAGVAALTWAADPTQSNEAVLNWLFQTTTPVTQAGNPTVRGMVCAGCIAQQLLPPVEPELEIVSPTDGSTFVESDTIEFEANFRDVEDQLSGIAVTVQWTSLTGPTAISSTDALFTEVLCPGSYTVEASVTDSDGFTTTDTVSFTVAAQGLRLSIPSGPTRQVRVLGGGLGPQTFDSFDLIASATAPTCADPNGTVDESQIQWDNQTLGQSIEPDGTTVTIGPSQLQNPAGESPYFVPVLVEASIEVDGIVASDSITLIPCSSTVGLEIGQSSPFGYPQCSSQAVFGDVLESLYDAFGTTDPDKIELIISGALDDLINGIWAKDIVETGFCDPTFCDPPIPGIWSDVLVDLGEVLVEFEVSEFDDLYISTIADTLPGFQGLFEAQRVEFAGLSAEYSDTAIALYEGATAAMDAAYLFFAPSEFGGQDGMQFLLQGQPEPIAIAPVQITSIVEASLAGYLTAYLQTADLESPLNASLAAYAATQAAIEVAEQNGAVFR